LLNSSRIQCIFGLNSNTSHFALQLKGNFDALLRCRETRAPPMHSQPFFQVLSRYPPPQKHLSTSIPSTTSYSYYLLNSVSLSLSGTHNHWIRNILIPVSSHILLPATLLPDSLKNLVMFSLHLLLILPKQAKLAHHAPLVSQIG
jgi:hypothetical protein